MNRSLSKYLATRALVRPLVGSAADFSCVDQAVIVPARAESAFLPRTLESVAANPPDALRRTLVVVVVNNPPPPAAQAAARDVVISWNAEAADNCRVLEWLEANRSAFDFPMAWIDAASPGRELPPRTGVGLARKLGCDTVLHQLASVIPNRIETPEKFILLNLDADAPVNRQYLPAVRNELLKSGLPGGVTRYAHGDAPDPTGQAAIARYELYLRYYVAGLLWARSPYAFHTVGSTIVCTAAGYVAAGGFSSKRRAGEDFYFVQQLIKTGGVRRLLGAEVFPSPRVSSRVPFGTGPAVREILATGNAPYRVYAPAVFPILRDLIEGIRRNPMMEAAALLDTLGPEAAAFLAGRGFDTRWSRFARQFTSPQHRVRAFHGWFDGLATVQFIHYLTANGRPKIPISDAWRELLLLAGRVPPDGCPSANELLDWVRHEKPDYPKTDG